MGVLRFVSVPVGVMRRKRLTSSGAAGECHNSVEHVMHFFGILDDLSTLSGMVYEQRVVMAESMKQDKGYGTIAVSGAESMSFGCMMMMPLICSHRRPFTAA